MATAKVTDADRGRLTVKLNSGGYQLNLLDLTCLKLATGRPCRIAVFGFISDPDYLLLERATLSHENTEGKHGMN
jgi:hypothetical protein